MKPKQYATLKGASRKTRANGKYAEIKNPLALERLDNRAMRRLKEKR